MSAWRGVHHQGEHRPTGSPSGRAWCLLCREWCYPGEEPGRWCARCEAEWDYPGDEPEAYWPLKVDKGSALVEVGCNGASLLPGGADG